MRSLLVLFIAVSMNAFAIDFKDYRVVCGNGESFSFGAGSQVVADGMAEGFCLGKGGVVSVLEMFE